MNLLQIIYKNIDEIKKYEKNPRYNENSIKEVAESIKRYGFKIPILIDKNNVIICGHTRLEASKLLKLNKVPCIVVEDLDEEKIKAFRLVDNKVSEYSNWDYKKLIEELKNIDDEFIKELNLMDELDISDDDFIKDIEITKEKKEQIMICPKCGEKI